CRVARARGGGGRGTAPDHRAHAVPRSDRPPGGRRCLREDYDIDGFTEAEDRDYEPVRDAMALMGLGRPK
ncbi:MAG: hypothetical protein AAB328_06500, partial [candidate division NC10 bacterium]